MSIKVLVYFDNLDKLRLSLQSVGEVLFRARYTNAEGYSKPSYDNLATGKHFNTVVPSRP